MKEGKAPEMTTARQKGSAARVAQHADGPVVHVAQTQLGVELHHAPADRVEHRVADLPRVEIRDA
jgi:hypothetical protein